LKEKIVLAIVAHPPNCWVLSCCWCIALDVCDANQPADIRCTIQYNLVQTLYKSLWVTSYASLQITGTWLLHISCIPSQLCITWKEWWLILVKYPFPSLASNWPFISYEFSLNFFSNCQLFTTNSTRFRLVLWKLYIASWYT
jgi:hypothetical protein